MCVCVGWSKPLLMDHKGGVLVPPTLSWGKCVGVECVGGGVCVRGGPTSMGGSFRSRTRRDWRTRLENLGPIAT